MPPRYQRPYPPDFWREAVGLVRASGVATDRAGGRVSPTSAVPVFAVRAAFVEIPARRAFPPRDDGVASVSVGDESDRPSSPYEAKEAEREVRGS